MEDGFDILLWKPTMLNFGSELPYIVNFIEQLLLKMLQGKKLSKLYTHTSIT